MFQLSTRFSLKKISNREFSHPGINEAAGEKFGCSF
jgi:hypothetical protein